MCNELVSVGNGPIVIINRACICYSSLAIVLPDLL